MVIALIIDRFDANNNANIKIALNIARQLSREHQVYVYGQHDCSSNGLANCDYEENDCIFYAHEAKFAKKIYEVKKSLEGKGRIKTLGVLLRHLDVVCCVVLNRILYFLTENTFEMYSTRKNFTGFVEKKQVQVLIAFTEPKDTIKEIIKIKDVKKIWYQLDPYSFNVYDKNKNRSRRHEEKFIKGVDYAFVTKQIYDEYSKCALQKYIDKLRVVQFPNLVKFTDLKNEAVFSRERINCVFAGTFYSGIRNPEFLLELFSKMTNSDIILHLYGGGCEEQVKSYAEKTPDRLLAHGRVSLDDTNSIIRQADVLVSLNNTNANQMPSKIIEYISTGLPIINICKIKDCPTLKVLNKYPLVYNIFEGEPVDISSIEKFICENVGKRIEWDYLFKEYYEYTPEAVGGEIEKVL